MILNYLLSATVIYHSQCDMLLSSTERLFHISTGLLIINIRSTGLISQVEYKGHFNFIDKLCQVWVKNQPKWTFQFHTIIRQIIVFTLRIKTRQLLKVSPLLYFDLTQSLPIRTKLLREEVHRPSRRYMQS